MNQGTDMINKRYIKGTGSGITLTNNEIKYIIKIVKSFGVSLQGTAEKFIIQKG